VCLQYARAPLQGATVSSIGLNITVNGARIALRQQTTRTWQILQLLPQLQPYDISLVSITAGLFKQPQNCRIVIAALTPAQVSGPCELIHMHIFTKLDKLMMVDVLLPAWQSPTIGYAIARVLKLSAVSCVSISLHLLQQ
jgi:hypothetical protein